MTQVSVDQRSAGLTWLRCLPRAVEAFFFTPASARPLGALRIGLAAVLLAQAWMLRGEILDLFAHDGIVRSELSRHFRVPGAPHLAWLIDPLSELGVSEASCIRAVCGAYVASLVLLATGFRTRVAAVAAWLLHWTLMNTASLLIYGVDRFAHIFLFYLVWTPAGRACSLDVALHRVPSVPTATARLGLRVLQLHLCLAYLASGIEKSTCAQWWNGELLWRVFSIPDYRRFNMDWLLDWPWLSQLGGWATLAIELGYCVFIWPRCTRRLWVTAAVMLHLGIAIFLGLHLFGFVMCVLTLALFGVSPEPSCGAKTAISMRGQSIGIR